MFGIRQKTSVLPYLGSLVVCFGSLQTSILSTRAEGRHSISTFPSRKPQLVDVHNSRLGYSTILCSSTSIRSLFMGCTHWSFIGVSPPTCAAKQPGVSAYAVPSSIKLLSRGDSSPPRRRHLSLNPDIHRKY